MKRFIFNGDTYDSSEEATDAVYAFAHDTFDEYLDECFEEIHIGSLTYTPSHVLKKTDPIAYRCMLSDYENCLGYDIKEELEDDDEDEDNEVEDED